jgi:hypothetical protein
VIIDNIIFIHPPRCSGTSIETSLVAGRSITLSRKHHTASVAKNICGTDVWTNSFKFAIVRNPFDRVISMYHAAWYSGIQRGVKFETLEEFLTSIPKVPHEAGITCSDYINEEMDYIIKFETRNDDIDEINKKYNIKLNKNIHNSRTLREKDYKTYHTPNTIQLVEKHFQDDLVQFNYKF